MSSRETQHTQRLGSMQRGSVEAAQRYPALSPRAGNASSSPNASFSSSSSQMSASLGSSPYGVPLSSPRSRSSASDLPFAASVGRAPHASVSPRERSPVSSPGFAAVSAMGVSLSSSLSRPPIQAFKLGEARASAGVARASLQPSATIVHARSNLSSLRIAPPQSAPDRSPNPANYSPSPATGSAPSPRSAAAAAAAFQGRFDRATASSASSAVASPMQRPLIAALLRTSPPAAVSISETAAFQTRLEHQTNLRAAQDASAAAAAAANQPFSTSSSALAHALRADAALPSPPEPMVLEALRSRILLASSSPPHSKALQAAKQQQADDEVRASLRRSQIGSSGGHDSFYSSDGSGDRPLTTRELDFDDQLMTLEQQQEERKYPPFGARMLADTDSPPRSNGLHHHPASPVQSAPSSAVQSPPLVAAKSPSATPGRSPPAAATAARATPVSIVASHSSYFVSSPIVRRQRAAMQHAQTQTPPSAQSRPPKGILHGQDLPPQPEPEEEEEEEAAPAAQPSSSDDEAEAEDPPDVLRARAKAAAAARESALRKLAAKEAREAKQKHELQQQQLQQQQTPSPVRTVRIEQPGAAVSPKQQTLTPQPLHHDHSPQPQEQQQPVTRFSPTALRPSAPEYVPPPLVHATPLSPPPQHSPSPPPAAASAVSAAVAAVAAPVPAVPAIAIPQVSSCAAVDEPKEQAQDEEDEDDEAQEEEEAQEENKQEEENEEEGAEEEEPTVTIQAIVEPQQPPATAAVKQPSPLKPATPQQQQSPPPPKQPASTPPQQQQPTSPKPLQPLQQQPAPAPVQPKMYSPRPLPQPPQQPMRAMLLPQPAVAQQQQQQQQQQTPTISAEPAEEEADAEEEAQEAEEDLDGGEDDDEVAIDHSDAVPDSPPSATAIPPPSRPIRYASDPVVSLSPIVASSTAGMLPPTPLALPASYTPGSSSNVHRSMRNAASHVSQSASPPSSSSSSASGLYPIPSAVPAAAEIDESEALSSSQRSDRSASSSSLSVPSSPLVTPSPTRNRGASHASALPVGATGSLRRSHSSQSPEQQRQNVSPAPQQPQRVLTHVDVIIVGAGLSGLTAASTLAEQGGSALSVAILEASGRVGGRTLTKHVTISNTKGWSAPAASTSSDPASSSPPTAAAAASNAAAVPPALPSSFNVQLDLGGQWVAPDHTALKALAAKWDCALVAQHHAGTKIAQVRGQVHHYSGRLPSYLGVWGLVKLQMLIWKIDRLARSLHEATTDSGNLQDWNQAAYFDSMSCASWMTECITSASLRRLFEAVVRGLFGMEPPEISMLYFLADVAASGCSMEKLIDIPNGNQDSLFAGGAQQLSEKLALATGFPGGAMENVHLFLDTPVRGVRLQHAAGAAAGSIESTHPVEVIYERSGGGQSFVLRCKHVILALAPMLYRHIAFTPALPLARRTLADRNIMGSIIKIVLLYPRAFWREAGFSGEAFGDCWTPPPAAADSDSSASAAAVMDSPIFQLYDGSKLVRSAVLDESGNEIAPEVLQPGLVVFINGQAALEWSARSAAERRAAVLRQLARWFATTAGDAPTGSTRISSVEIGSPLYYEEQDWTRETWVRGCPIAGFPPGALWAAAHALHSSAFDGRMHFAGTEESTVATGFMEGAVRAGQQAALAVMSDRKARSNKTRKAAAAASSASSAEASTASTEETKLRYAPPRRSIVEQHGVDGAPSSWFATLVLISMLLLAVLLMLRAYALSLPPALQHEFEVWIEQMLWSTVQSPFTLWRLWQSRASNDSASASPSCACSPSPL